MTDNTKAIDQTKVFNEKLNGRLAMLGLTIGLITEALTGNGIIEQVFGFFRGPLRYNRQGSTWTHSLPTIGKTYIEFRRLHVTSIGENSLLKFFL